MSEEATRARRVPFATDEVEKLYDRWREDPATARKAADALEADPLRVLSEHFELSHEQQREIDRLGRDELHLGVKGLIEALRQEHPVRIRIEKTFPGRGLGVLGCGCCYTAARRETD
ncbi:MAG TPA: hypothetical protein VG248_11665 [Caulobacteraceae bacterium]|jgi:hypothetical protein|nr:hypothetical protein [Caulobacteraceae bacterium]